MGRFWDGSPAAGTSRMSRLGVETHRHAEVGLCGVATPSEVSNESSLRLPQQRMQDGLPTTTEVALLGLKHF